MTRSKGTITSQDNSGMIGDDECMDVEVAGSIINIEDDWGCGFVVVTMADSGFL